MLADGAFKQQAGQDKKLEMAMASRGVGVVALADKQVEQSKSYLNQGSGEWMVGPGGTRWGGRRDGSVREAGC